MKSDLSDNQLRRVDLTLLLVFLGLIRHGKAARVAEDLGLTPSAISQAMGRLRDVFGDPLFLRRPHGMEPTAVALALHPPVSQAVEALRSALGHAQHFDPGTATGTIRIGALDAEQAVLVPRIVGRLRGVAPGLRVAVLPLGRQMAIDGLVENRIDLALGFIWTRPDTVRRLKLYDESYLVAGPIRAPGSPALSLDDYCEADHVLVSPGGDLRGVVDERLTAMGRSRQVILALPSFLPALAAAAKADALVTLPRRIASQFASRFGMELSEPPLDVRSFPVELYWHVRSERDPMSQWLRSLIADDLAEPKT